jgi:hypothetical protein
MNEILKNWVWDTLTCDVMSPELLDNDLDVKLLSIQVK